MGNEERAEVSKIASIYKLRCRYGKSTHLAPSTLIKARWVGWAGHNEHYCNVQSVCVCVRKRDWSTHGFKYSITASIQWLTDTNCVIGSD